MCSGNADVIDAKNVTAHVDNPKDGLRSPRVHISWIDPPNPNGLVVLYDIELARVDVPFVSEFMDS